MHLKSIFQNANKLDAYLSNLATHIRNNGTLQEKASFFGKTSGITASSPYCIDIVGHSMGGLVARYYIENIGKDENIRKLITIGTPHWGSTLANASNGVGFFGMHRLCDHDLTTNSNMNGGSNGTLLNNCSLCGGSSYTLTDELNYDVDRSTKYYAIAGIDYPASTLDKNDRKIVLNSNYTTTTEISDIIKNDHSSFGLISLDLEGDNVVEFWSQIGCLGSQLFGIEKKIEFEKIFVNIDTDDGNAVSTDNHFHGKMPHRQMVMEMVKDFLND